MAKDKKVKVFNNGFEIRKHNKKIDLAENIHEDGNSNVIIRFRFADENPEKPAVKHTVLKGKIRESYIKISTDTLEDLLTSYMVYKKTKLQSNPPNNTGDKN